MPSVFCNTSPLQYLHQLGLLSQLRRLVETIVVPPAVVAELHAGRLVGVDVPDVQSLSWVTVLAPAGTPVLPLVTDLGAGETQVLALELEVRESLLVLDDALARRVAEILGLRLTGTLGILLDLKRRGLLETVEPQLDRLSALGFRLADHTRRAVLDLAGEAAE